MAYYTKCSKDSEYLAKTQSIQQRRYLFKINKVSQLYDIPRRNIQSKFHLFKAYFYVQYVWQSSLSMCDWENITSGAFTVHMRYMTQKSLSEQMNIDFPWGISFQFVA